MTKANDKKEFLTVQEVLDRYFKAFETTDADEELRDPSQEGRELAEEIVGGLEIASKRSRKKPQASR